MKWLSIDGLALLMGGSAVCATVSPLRRRQEMNKKNIADHESLIPGQSDNVARSRRHQNPTNWSNNDTTRNRRRHLRRRQEQQLQQPQQSTEEERRSITVDFGTDVNGNPLERGTVIDRNILLQGSVSVEARRADKIQYNGPFADGMIFNARQVSGQDYDLSNFPFLGNLFIISADNDSDDPDDAGKGGEIWIDFHRNVHLQSIRFIDVEEAGSDLALWNDADEKLMGVKIPTVRNGGQKVLQFDNAKREGGVRRVKIYLAGSGAIDDIQFCESVQNQNLSQPGASLQLPPPPQRTIFPPPPQRKVSPPPRDARVVRRFFIDGCKCASFNANGSRLATVNSVNRRIDIWDLNQEESESPVLSLEIARFVRNLKYSPDGTHIAASTFGEVWVWDALLGGDPKAILNFSSRPMAWSPDSRHLTLQSDDDAQDHVVYLVRNVVEGPDIMEAIIIGRARASVQSLDFSPDGNFVAGGGQFVAKDETAPVAIWSVMGDDATERTFLDHSTTRGSRIEFVQYSPDGQRLLAVADFEPQIFIWNPATGERVLTLKTDQLAEVDTDSGDPIFSSHHVAPWNPNGRNLATVGVEGDIRIWDSQTGTLVLSIPSTTDPFSLIWSPNGQFLAAAQEFGQNELLIYQLLS